MDLMVTLATEQHYSRSCHSVVSHDQRPETLGVQICRITVFCNAQRSIAPTGVCSPARRGPSHSPPFVRVKPMRSSTSRLPTQRTASLPSSLPWPSAHHPPRAVRWGSSRVPKGKNLHIRCMCAGRTGCERGAGGPITAVRRRGGEGLDGAGSM
jgi:hypothetical protein